MKKIILTNISIIFCFIFFFLCFFATDTTGLNNSNTLKFAQLSDVHLNPHGKIKGSRMIPYSSALLKDAISQINKKKDINFVVFTGDSIDYPNIKFLKSFSDKVNKLNIPWYICAGNHDSQSKSSKSLFLKLIKKNNPNFKSNELYYTVTFGKYIFIFMDGTIKSRITANGYFPKKELLWLDKKLETNKDHYALIFQHFPLITPYKSKDHIVLNADEYLSILNKHKNVLAVFSGHYHAAKILTVNNVVHVSTPALVQYPNAFRIVTLKNQGNTVNINFQFVQTRLKSVINESYHLSKSPDLHKGRPNDRNTSITLSKSL